MWRSIAKLIVDIATPLLLLSCGFAALQSYQYGKFEYFIGTALGSFVVFLSVLAIGGGVVARIRKIHEIDYLESFVVGAIIYSCLMMLLGLFAPVGFLYCVIGVAVLSLGLLLRSRPQFTPLSRFKWLALCGLFLAAEFWSRENLQPHLLTSDGSVIVHPWVDYFFHARMTGVFGSSSSHLGNFQISGQPLPFYHYASYMIAASVQSLSHAPSMSMTPAFFAAFGVFLTGVAAFIGARFLARRWGAQEFSERIGAIASLFTLVIPDPSYFGLGNRWTSYFFFQQVGPAGSFAVVSMALSWMFFAESYFLAALVFLLMTSFFKVQIFMLYGPATLLAFIWFKRNISRRIQIGLTLLLIASVAATLRLMSHIPMSPTLGFSMSGVGQNLEMMINLFPGSMGKHWHTLMGASSGYPRLLLIGIPLVLISTYGLWLVPLAIWRRGRVPWLILAMHLIAALAMGLNEGYGDPYEVIHKTFVLPYFAIVVWSAALIAMKLGKYSRSALPILILALIGPMYFGKTVQSGIPMAPARMDLKLPVGIYSCARWIQRNTPRTAMIQFDHPDSFLALPAIADRKTFATHTVVNSKESPPGLEANQWLISSALLKDFPEFKNEIRETHLDYFILTQLPSGWPTSGLPIAFQAKGCVILKL